MVRTLRRRLQIVWMEDDYDKTGYERLLASMCCQWNGRLNANIDDNSGDVWKFFLQERRQLERRAATEKGQVDDGEAHNGVHVS